METNNSFSNRLNNYFGGNIKLSYVLSDNVFIVTNEENVYCFEKDSTYSYAIVICSDNSKADILIEEKRFKQLCGKKVKDIKFTYNESVILTDNHTVYTIMSYNRNNIKLQLRDEFLGKNVSKTSCGKNFSIILTDDNCVYGWGDNTYRQISGEKTQYYPKAIELKSNKYFNSEKIQTIYCGKYHCLALSQNNNVYLWGQIDIKKNNLTKDYFSIFPPKLINNSPISNICAHRRQSYLLTTTGDVLYIKYNYNDLDGIRLNYKLNKINFPEVIIDIATTTHKELFFVAKSKTGKIYILRNNSDDTYCIPELTEFNNFDDIYLHYIKENYRPIEGKVSKFTDSFYKNGKFDTDIEEKIEIGRGCYGKVYKKYPNQRYSSAIKVIKFDKHSEDDFVNELIICQHIKDLRSDYTVNYNNFWIEKHIIEKKYRKFQKIKLYIDMDFCDFSLEKFIKEIRLSDKLYKNEILTELGFYITTKIFFQVLEGVNNLHINRPNIIHRDLKPDNIFIQFINMSEFVVKVGDFGCSTIHKITGQSHTSRRGNYNFAAPEVENGELYDTRADIYSLGRILGLLLSMNIKRCIHPEPIPKYLIDQNANIQIILKKMTQNKQEDRYSTILDIIESEESIKLNKTDINLTTILRDFLNHTNSKVLNITKIILHYLKFEVLNAYFYNNIALAHISELTLIIKTKTDKVYEFDLTNIYDMYEEYSLINWTEIIERHVIMEACDRKFIDFYNSHYYGLGKSEDGHIYYWSQRNQNPKLKCIANSNNYQIKCFTYGVYKNCYILTEANQILLYDFGSEVLKYLKINSELNNLDKFVSITISYTHIEPEKHPQTLLLLLTETGNVYVIAVEVRTGFSEVEEIENQSIFTLLDYISLNVSEDYAEKLKDKKFIRIIGNGEMTILYMRDDRFYAFNQLHRMFEFDSFPRVNRMYVLSKTGAYYNENIMDKSTLSALKFMSQQIAKEVVYEI